MLDRIPVVGSGVVKALQQGKQLIRRGIYHSTMFEEMGFQYIGPVDGHNVLELTRLFNNLQEQFAPVFLHIVTQKGKGLKPAEENPGEFHSVSAFDLNHLTNPKCRPTIPSRPVSAPRSHSWAKRKSACAQSPRP